MKQKIIALLISSLLVGAAFAKEDVATDPSKQNDEQILGFLVVLNKNEINAANVVANKKVTHEVKQYADMIHKDHTKNLKETMDLSHKIGKPIKADETKTLEQKGKEEVTSLKPLKAKELQKTYIDNTVTDHEQALQTIDDKLKTVTNTDLKKHLETTREHVSQHLDKAKAIQTDLAQTS